MRNTETGAHKAFAIAICIILALSGFALVAIAVVTPFGRIMNTVLNYEKNFKIPSAIQDSLSFSTTVTNDSFKGVIEEGKETSFDIDLPAFGSVKGYWNAYSTRATANNSQVFTGSPTNTNPHFADFIEIGEYENPTSTVIPHCRITFLFGSECINQTIEINATMFCDYPSYIPPDKYEDQAFLAQRNFTLLVISHQQADSVNTARIYTNYDLLSRIFAVAGGFVAMGWILYCGAAIYPKISKLGSKAFSDSTVYGGLLFIIVFVLISVFIFYLFFGLTHFESF